MRVKSAVIAAVYRKVRLQLEGSRDLSFSLTHTERLGIATEKRNGSQTENFLTVPRET